MAITTKGTIIRWHIIPGRAVIKAPLMKAAIVNSEWVSKAIMYLAVPQTNLPKIMESISETYIYSGFLGSIFENSAVKPP